MFHVKHRRRKLRISCFAVNDKARSLRYASSSQQDPLRWVLLGSP